MIPKTVNCDPFTLERLNLLANNPQRGNKTRYQLTDDHTHSKITTLREETPEKPYWILITHSTVNTHESSTSLPDGIPSDYDAPTILEAATTILTHYVRSGTWLYDEGHIYCKEERSERNTNLTIAMGKTSTNSLQIYSKKSTVTRFQEAIVPPSRMGMALLRRLA